MGNDFYRNYNKNVFEGEEFSVTNSDLEKARMENSKKKWDYYKKSRSSSSMSYDSETERRKALWELGRKSNPMLKHREDLD